MLISAGASIAQASNNQAAESRRQQELEASIRAQQMKQREADAMVNNEIQKVAASTPEADRAAAQQDFLTQLRRTRASEVGGNPAAGAVSDDYTSDLSGAQANVIDFGKRSADIASRISAPGRQRMREGVSSNRLNTQLGRIARESSGNDFLTRLRMQAMQPNPWVDAAAGIAQGAASGMAANGGFSGNKTWVDGTRSSGSTAAQRRNNFGY